MNRCRKQIILLLILCSTIILEGCWNYKEIDDMAISAGAAVDYDIDNENLILTVEIVAHEDIGGGQTEIASEEVTGEGKVFFDAARNIISKIGKKIFWSHSGVLILGRDIIGNEEKLLGVLDWYKRDSETRPDIWVLVSLEKTAGEIIADSDEELQKITSFYLDDLLTNEGSISKFYAVPFWKFIDELASKGIEPTLPTVMMSTKKEEIERVKTTDNQDGDEIIPTITGNAVFKGTKIAGYLDLIESRSLLILRDELKGGVIVIETEGESTSKDSKVTLEVLKSKTETTPIFNNDNITINIEVEITCNIAEITSEEDFMSEDLREKLKKDGEEVIKSELEHLIKLLQTQYKSDAIGIGNIVERKNPKLWEKLEDSWDVEFSNVAINPSVTLEIIGSALRSKPIETN